MGAAFEVGVPSPPNTPAHQNKEATVNAERDSTHRHQARGHCERRRRGFITAVMVPPSRTPRQPSRGARIGNTRVVHESAPRSGGAESNFPGRKPGWDTPTLCYPHVGWHRLASRRPVIVHAQHLLFEIIPEVGNAGASTTPFGRAAGNRGGNRGFADGRRPALCSGS